MSTRSESAWIDSRREWWVLGVCSSVAVDGFPHTTSPEVIASFLRGDDEEAARPARGFDEERRRTQMYSSAAFSGRTSTVAATEATSPRVIFCTYVSLPRVVEAQELLRQNSSSSSTLTSSPYSFDLCICDEAHVTAGKTASPTTTSSSSSSSSPASLSLPSRRDGVSARSTTLSTTRSDTYAFNDEPGEVEDANDDDGENDGEDADAFGQEESSIDNTQSGPGLKTMKTAARALDGEYLRATHRLFLTATPRIFSLQRRFGGEPGGLGSSAWGSDGAIDEVASMDDEVLYGPTVYRLSFSEAIRRGVTVPLKLLVVDTSDGYDDLIARFPNLRIELADVPGAEEDGMEHRRGGEADAAVWSRGPEALNATTSPKRPRASRSWRRGGGEVRSPNNERVCGAGAAGAFVSRDGRVQAPRAADHFLLPRDQRLGA